MDSDHFPSCHTQNAEGRSEASENSVFQIPNLCSETSSAGGGRTVCRPARGVWGILRHPIHRVRVKSRASDCSWGCTGVISERSQTVQIVTPRPPYHSCNTFRMRFLCDEMFSDNRNWRRELIAVGSLQVRRTYRSLLP